MVYFGAGFQDPDTSTADLFVMHVWHPMKWALAKKYHFAKKANVLHSFDAG